MCNLPKGELFDGLGNVREQDYLALWLKMPFMRLVSSGTGDV